MARRIKTSHTQTTILAKENLDNPKITPMKTGQHSEITRYKHENRRKITSRWHTGTHLAYACRRDNMVLRPWKKKTNDLLSFRTGGLNHPLLCKGSSVAVLDPLFFTPPHHPQPRLKKCSDLAGLTLYYLSLTILWRNRHRPALFHK